jgi:hypothetical protein
VKLITLSDGSQTKVSDEDFFYLSGYRWSRMPKGYVYRTESVPGSRLKESVYLHREVGKRMGLNLVLLDVDHVDRDKLNNQRENLEAKTKAQNNANTGVSRRNVSGYKGVRFVHGKWVAQIGINGRPLYLGSSDDINVAIQLRLMAEEKYFGKAEQ